MIRKLIKEMILAESAWTPDSLGSDYEIVITNRYSTGQKIVKLFNKSNQALDGFVTISKPNDYDGPCNGSWVINQSSVSQHLSGAGPLLYDIAMEIAGDDGLAADRSTVTPAARKVWDFYLTRRSDVLAIPLDDLFGSITPMDPDDDCRQSAAYSESDYENGEPPDIDWEPGSDESNRNLKKLHRGRKMSFRGSPLSKVYKKNGRPTIDSLKKLGLIRWD